MYLGYFLKVNSSKYNAHVVPREQAYVYKINTIYIFNVKTFPRFTGICFKHKKLRIAGNFFPQSKKFVCMGAKSPNDMYQFVVDLKKIGFADVD